MTARRHFERIGELLWADSVLTPIARLLLLGLADWSNSQGVADCTFAELSLFASVDKRTIHTRLKELEKAGWIHIDHAAGDYGQNVYRILR